MDVRPACRLLVLCLCVTGCGRAVPPPAVAPVADTPAVARPAARARVRPVADTPAAVRPADTVPAPRTARLANPGRLRLVAANLSSGTRQNYDRGHGLRILQGIQPDVVMLQEFNYRSNSAGDLQQFAEQVMGGAGASYSRESGSPIPNGIISRYPIVASGEWADPHAGNRDFAWARIDLPGPVDLWAVSIHLLTTKTAERKAEAEVLVARLRESVPAGAYLAVGGDYNTGTRNEACYAVLRQLLATDVPPPADAEGNSNTNMTRTKMYDAVLVNAALQRLAMPVQAGGRSFPHGLVLDVRRFTPLNAFAPATAADGSAPSMQHMAVIRDFRLP